MTFLLQSDISRMVAEDSNPESIHLACAQLESLRPQENKTETASVGTSVGTNRSMEDDNIVKLDSTGPESDNVATRQRSNGISISERPAKKMKVKSGSSYGMTEPLPKRRFSLSGICSETTEKDEQGGLEPNAENRDPELFAILTGHKLLSKDIVAFSLTEAAWTRLHQAYPQIDVSTRDSREKAKVTLLQQGIDLTNQHYKGGILENENYKIRTCAWCFRTTLHVFIKIFPKVMFPVPRWQMVCMSCCEPTLRCITKGCLETVRGQDKFCPSHSILKPRLPDVRNAPCPRCKTQGDHPVVEKNMLLRHVYRCRNGDCEQRLLQCMNYVEPVNSISFQEPLTPGLPMPRSPSSSISFQEPVLTPELVPTPPPSSSLSSSSPLSGEAASPPTSTKHYSLYSTSLGACVSLYQCPWCNSLNMRCKCQPTTDGGTNPEQKCLGWALGGNWDDFFCAGCSRESTSYLDEVTCAWCLRAPSDTGIPMATLGKRGLMAPYFIGCVNKDRLNPTCDRCAMGATEFEIAAQKFIKSRDADSSRKPHEMLDAVLYASEGQKKALTGGHWLDWATLVAGGISLRQGVAMTLGFSLIKFRDIGDASLEAWEIISKPHYGIGPRASDSYHLGPFTDWPTVVHRVIENALPPAFHEEKDSIESLQEEFLHKVWNRYFSKCYDQQRSRIRDLVMRTSGSFLRKNLPTTPSARACVLHYLSLLDNLQTATVKRQSRVDTAGILMDAKSAIGNVQTLLQAAGVIPVPAVGIGGAACAMAKVAWAPISLAWMLKGLVQWAIGSTEGVLVNGLKMIISFQFALRALTGVQIAKLQPTDHEIDTWLANERTFIDDLSVCLNGISSDWSKSISKSVTWVQKGYSVTHSGEMQSWKKMGQIQFTQKDEMPIRLVSKSSNLRASIKELRQFFPGALKALLEEKFSVKFADPGHCDLRNISEMTFQGQLGVFALELGIDGRTEYYNLCFPRLLLQQRKDWKKTWNLMRSVHML